MPHYYSCTVLAGMLTYFGTTVADHAYMYLQPWPFALRYSLQQLVGRIWSKTAILEDHQQVSCTAAKLPLPQLTTQWYVK